MYKKCVQHTISVFTKVSMQIICTSVYLHELSTESQNKAISWVSLNTQVKLTPREHTLKRTGRQEKMLSVWLGDLERTYTQKQDCPTVRATGDI